MKTKMLKVLLGALLVVGGVTSATSARADHDLSPYDGYDCLGNICVGDTVRVIGGEWVGHAGSVVGVDNYYDTVTVLNSSGYYLYPSIRHVQLIYDGSNRNCTADFCVNDIIQVVSGIYRGERGRIISTDDRYYQVTMLSDRGQYITVSISDIYLIQRGPRPGPGPRPVPPPRPRPPHPLCPPGYVWDAYRQVCVRAGPVPRPVPPRPIPPRPRPVPPRPVPPRPVPPRPRGECPPMTHYDPVIGRCVR